MIGPDAHPPRAVLYGAELTSPDWDPCSTLVDDLVRMLRDADWRITYVTSGPVRDVREVKLLRRQGVAVFPDDDDVRDDLLAAAPFDVAIFLSSETAARHLPAVRRRAPATPSVVALLPAEPGSIEGNEPGPHVLETADAVAVTSNRDADAVRERFPSATLHVLPDVGILQASPRPFEERRGVLIVGTSSERWWAVRATLPPAILAEHPVYVASDACMDEEGSLGNIPGCLGRIPSLLPYLEATRLVAVLGARPPASPALAIHALMFGTPVVTTLEIARTLGLEAEPAAEIVEDDLRGLADRIAQLLTDEHRWSLSAVAARSRIVERHGHQAAQRALVDVLDALDTRIAAA